jgi:hypothetical protein
MPENTTVQCQTCNGREVCWTGKDLGAHGPDTLVDCPDCSEKGRKFAQLMKDIKFGKYTTKSMIELITKRHKRNDENK